MSDFYTQLLPFIFTVNSVIFLFILHLRFRILLFFFLNNKTSVEKKASPTHKNVQHKTKFFCTQPSLYFVIELKDHKKKTEKKIFLFKTNEHNCFVYVFFWKEWNVFNENQRKCSNFEWGKWSRIDCYLIMMNCWKVKKEKTNFKESFVHLLIHWILHSNLFRVCTPLLFLNSWVNERMCTHRSSSKPFCVGLRTTKYTNAKYEKQNFTKMGKKRKQQHSWTELNEILSFVFIKIIYL